jgi:hypothetical protein
MKFRAPRMNANLRTPARHLCREILDRVLIPATDFCAPSLTITRSTAPARLHQGTAQHVHDERGAPGGYLWGARTRAEF